MMQALAAVSPKRIRARVVLILRVFLFVLKRWQVPVVFLGGVSLTRSLWRAVLRISA